MTFRLVLASLVLAIDLLLLPAMARLPPYLPVRGQPSRVEAWRDEWLHRPVDAGFTLLRPQTEADREARYLWLLIQIVLAAPVIWLLWPVAPNGTLTRDGVPVPDPSNAAGSARWRSRKALAEALNVANIHREVPPAGFLAGVDTPSRPRLAYLVPGPGERSVTNPHVLILGASGAGKTRRLVLPNLWLLGEAHAGGEPNSIIITDPKGEIYAHTAEYFGELGYAVHTLNLIDPRRSSGYDPIHEIVLELERGDTSRASEAAWDAAHAFGAVDLTANSKDDPFFRNAAESVIAATILYVAARAPEHQRTMTTVYRMITEYGQQGGQLLDTVFDSIGDLTDPARLAYGVAALSQDKTRAAILTTAAVNLRLFADPAVSAMTAQSDYDLASIGQQPTVVYLLLPDDRSARNAIAAMYLSQTYTALSRLAAMSEGGRLPVSTYWMLDEFANIARWRDFDRMIAVMRGRGMAAMIVLQALQQLEARYGRETAAVISSNCDNWLYLRTNDQGTAQTISKKLGEYTIRTRTNNTSARRYDVSSGSSELLTGRPLMTSDEILRWPMGQALLMQAGQFPAKLPLADIDEWPAEFKPGGPPPIRQDRPPEEPWLPLVGEWVS